MNAMTLADFIISDAAVAISRTDGVGDFQVFSAPAMRIWLTQRN
jgi:multidrug efflux pump